MTNTLPDLPSIAKNIRRAILAMAHRSKSPHVGSCLSLADILAVLYFDVLKIEPWEDRDIFILSKGHAAMALYAALSERGIISKEILDGYYQDNGTLPAHLDKMSVAGVEVSAGSLGHGFNIGLGMAYGFKHQGTARQVYALIGDGESQEGSIWEGALFAPRLGLDNFTALVDYNNLQGYGRPSELCAFEPFKDKWVSFGWEAIEVDGHDYEAIRNALRSSRCNKPRVIIAKTIKGKGVSFMENQLIWHYYIVTDDHLKQAGVELS